MESNYRTFPFIQLLIKYRSEIHFIYNCKLGILQLRIFAEQGDWKKDTIEIKSAEYLEIIQKKNVNINRLVNNVVLVQKDLTLYCDSALLFKSSNLAKVYGNVHFNQADSIHAYGDSAIYDGNTKTAKLYNKVKLTDNSMTLTTDNLSYDMSTKVANLY